MRARAPGAVRRPGATARPSASRAATVPRSAISAGRGKGASRRSFFRVRSRTPAVRGNGSRPRRGGDGAAKRFVRSDGTPRRDPRRAGSGGPKRDSRGSGGGGGREMRRDGPQRRPSSSAPKKRSARGGDDRKRTSKSTDDRNPTHSSVDYPSAKFRRKNEAAEPAPAAARASLRKVRRPAAEIVQRPTRARPSKKSAPTRRRKLRTTEAGDELARIAGRGAKHAQTDLAKAAEAFAAGRERDAARILRPLRDAYPDASAVRELLGLCQYRLGQYAAATKELDAFVELTNSVEQHPVLMDCARALGKHRRVAELWEELATASPSGALVTEGRIVLAGSLADQGRLTEAIATLDRRVGQPNRVQDHHVRVWYALADLYERAGDLPKARELFLRIRQYDAGFADAAERLATLG